MPDVRMPDGTILRNVPEGTKRADIERAYQKARQAKAVPDQRPTSHVEGFLEGINKAGANALNYVEQMPGVGAPAKMLGMVLGATRGDPSLSSNIKRFARDQQAKSPNRGSTGGRIAGEIVGTLPTAMAPGGILAQGAMSGALVTENPNDPKGLMRDMTLGAVANKAGQQFGKRVVAPVAERVGRTAPVRRLGEAAAKLTGRAPLPLPRISRPEKTIIKATREGPPLRKATKLDEIRRNVADAADLGLPYALADASPQLRAVGGSAARFSPEAQALAMKNFDPRALGQADRAVNAVDSMLAPVTNIEQRAGEIRTAASAAARPHYEAAYAQQAPIDDELASMLRRPAGKAALKRAYEIAANEGRDPAQLGFILDDSGEVTLRETIARDAGRFAPQRLGNERNELTRRTVRAWNGAEIPKVGPVDMVGWLRLQGGLANQGGELGHMGMTNAPRRMDFVGQEARFGPLVNDAGGMNLDDAAHRAWEAGYFPELPERPTVNQFLDALRETHEGRARRFLPDDMREVERFQGAQAQRYDLQQQRFETGGTVRDKSYPADDQPFAPLEAYGEMKPVQHPTMETLDLVKRGLDSTLNDFRDPITRRLDLEGNPVAGSVNELLQQFKGRLDTISEPYKQARQVYSEGIAPRTALRLGYNEMSNNALPQRQFDEALGTLNERTLPEAQRGYATAMADNVNKQRLSGNPYNAVYGSTNQQRNVGTLFPEGAPRFKRQYELEGDMALTRQKVLGGSDTQARNIGDQIFQSDAANAGIDAGVQTLTGGGVPGATKLAGYVARNFLGDGKIGLLGAQRKADAVAPTLFDTSNPQGILEYLDDLARKMAEDQARKEAYGKVGGLLRLPVAPFVVGGSNR